ncbi:MAG: PhnD/SsuA/transferrin family substrate-binding protein [Campylobacterota bacterium]|nr:PhnD/SsuA/transferrin family substrate-binding protein [Campylobacterota bacterium]
MFLRISILLILFTSFVFSDATIKIGVLAKRGADVALQKYTATAKYLSDEIEGHTFEIVPLGFEELGLSVKNAEIDFVLTNTAYYVELEYLYGVSRIATLKNISGDGVVVSSFGGVIFTKEDSGIDSLKDLQGKRFGAVNINSFGGWVMAQKELLDHGIEIDDFSEFKFFGSHDKVVLAMKNGEIDAGTVRTDTLERMSNEKIIDCENCKILSKKEYAGFPFKVSTALYPEWPFAKLSLTPQKLSNDVLIALLHMSQSSKAAEDSKIAGWTIPLDYSKVHALLEELELSFYAKLSDFTFARLYEKYKVWFFVVIAGFLTVLSFLFYISRLNSRLKRNRDEIKLLNTGLEQKVHERTLDLEKMYSQEKYLKEVVKTIADVNKLLVSSYSTQTIINNSMQTLAKNNYYKFVWIGLIKDNLLEVVSQSRENKNILKEHCYRLEDHTDSFAFASAKSCIELNTTVLDKLPKEYSFKISADTYNCTSCWLIVLPLRSSEDNEPLGTLSVFSEHENGFVPEEIKMLENLATDIAYALNAIEQRTMLENMELEKISNYEETILAFVNIIEQRDSYTAGHTVRVAKYCRLIAKEMGIDEQDIIKLEQAAILHDIGKVVTPDAILLKPGRLTSLEYELIKEHSEAGFQMLSRIEMYKDLAQIIRYHHVHYDGTGYPTTSKDTPYEVSLLSYIMVVADAFDAMTSNRIYKARKNVAEAIVEIKKFSGTQFHPDVAKAAVNILETISITDTSQLPSNAFEEQRFAYFFKDSLTGAYNENYLKLTLVENQDDTRCLYFIELKNFSMFNQKYGWEKGNEFLQQFYSTLENKYKNSMIFRYQGDDFILIFNEHQVVTKDDVLSFKGFEDSGILVNISHYDLKDEVPSF